MTKELFVSSTPHETKVGLVEDDLLAEIYLERENEYTLAGSIYKGRVTRVLPGMQSAFVDIGLERDAFLYVSDFMELEDGDDVEDVATARPAQEVRYPSQPADSRSEGRSADGSAAAAAPAPYEQQGTAESAPPEESRTPGSESRGDRGGWRGRRRRGRRGDRGMPESKFAHPAGETPQEQPAAYERAGGDRPGADRPRFERPITERRFSREDRPAREDRSSYGPPPGYQPILLPGESISKYRNAQPRAAETRPDSSLHSQIPEAPAPPIAETFPEDEPIFGSEHDADYDSHSTDHEAQAEAHPADAFEAHEEISEQIHNFNHQAEEVAEPRSRWVAQELHEDAFDAVPAGTATKPEAEARIELAPRDAEEIEVEEIELPGADSSSEPSEPPKLAAGAMPGRMEEEEIEEEEADLASYVEELEEDAAFEELEEETHAAHEYQAPVGNEIAASSEPSGEESTPFSAEPVSSEEADVAEASEVDDAAEEEAEVEEAQAEAEALLAAESGTGDARVEVRAPSGSAGYTQRARRPGFDRRGQRGRRGGSGGSRFRRRENHQLPQISDLLKEGQEILVQIAKEPIGKKGARITSHIALPGRFLVFMPTVNHTGVSRKIASEEERQRLKRIILSERENGHGGFIVRTAAQNASEDELRADIRFLKGLWNEIRTRGESSKPPALIYHDLNVVERVLRDQVTSDFSVIWVDTEAEYERTLRFFQRFQPALVKRVKLYSKETPLFEQFGLNEEINKALKSKVWLKSGGYIVINQTEALVAIDVNTGKYVGKTTRLEDTIVKTNVDAIREIVRQVRLRDLGGIIVIDFIDMDERRNRQKVMQALEEALRADRAPSKALQFNDFGLVAITRKRVKQSLERTIGAPCPYCQSTGFVKSVGTVCNEIYVEMRKISNHLEHSDVMLRVNPEVAKQLKSNNGKALLELEELTKKTVIVKSDPALHQEQFDIN